MKANELMIGDWVNVLTLKGIVAKQFEKDDYDFIEENGDRWQPIPLTPEILEKNGIILEDAQFAVANYALINRAENDDVIMDYIGVANDRGDWWVTIRTAPALISKHNCSYRRRLEYVHEFQLALRACGYRKFANNLKV